MDAYAQVDYEQMVSNSLLNLSTEASELVLDARSKER